MTSNNLPRLHGETAFIAGVATGIGRAIALAFAHHGARVFCADIDTEGAAAVAGEVTAEGGVASSSPCDVSDAESVRMATDAAIEQFGELSCLVSNAAVFTPVAPVESLEEDDWRRALDVNLTGAFLICKHGIPHLRARGGGSVIITASQMARVATAGQAAYCASKGALVQLAKVMALDHAADGIRVNTLSPGGTATGRLERRFGTMEEAERIWGPKHPLGRLGRVEEIANGAVFLASAESSNMTGADLLLDGGYSAW